MQTKTYFASDFHLGVPDREQSLEREKRIVRWLDGAGKDAAAIYLLGDIFDFWFEYKRVVPRGYVRLLGKLAELRDKGIPIFTFRGNHDQWMFGYFEEELGIKVYSSPLTLTLGDKKFYIGHGDGVGPGDRGYKFIKNVFSNPACQWLFRLIHPDLGIRIALYWSRRSRIANGQAADPFRGEDGEWQVIHAREILAKEHFDYFIFGHRHLPLDIPLGKSRFINLGDWIHHNSYAVFDGNELHLKTYESA